MRSAICDRAGATAFIERMYLGLCDPNDTSCLGYTNSNNRKPPTAPCITDLPQHSGGNILNDCHITPYFRRTKKPNFAASTTEEAPGVGMSAYSSTSRRTTMSPPHCPALHTARKIAERAGSDEQKANHFRWIKLHQLVFKGISFPILLMAFS